MAIKCCDGAVEPLFSIFQIRGEAISLSFEVLCAGSDGDSGGWHGWSFGAFCKHDFLRLRRKIAVERERQSPLGGVLEADESYFGPQRVRGKCGRGAGGKTIVFGLFKRGDKVYTAIVPNASKAALQAVIRGRASLGSVLHTDGWAGYNGLVDLGFDKHFRVEHRENEFAWQGNHINGIESFWSFAKRRLARFCGVPRHTFYLHLKETEFRFNHRDKDLYRVLIHSLRKDPL